MRSARHNIEVLKRRSDWLRKTAKPTDHRALAELSAIEWAILNTEHIAEREEALEAEALK
jgi:hypothetical protein